ncbi:MAG: hypothetical protein WCG84_01440 [Candidatus Moraniibacteriota bacterium]
MDSVQIIVAWLAQLPIVVFFRWFLIVYCAVLFIDIILLLWVHGLRGDIRKNRYGTGERPLKSMLSLRREWQHILDRLKKNDPNENKLAILEADQFTDRVLQEIGYPGINLQERLDAMALVSFESVDKAIEAHQIRNRIIFDTEWHPTREETTHALGLFQDFLDHWEIV